MREDHYHLIGGDPLANRKLPELPKSVAVFMDALVGTLLARGLFDMLSPPTPARLLTGALVLVAMALFWKQYLKRPWLVLSAFFVGTLLGRAILLN